MDYQRGRASALPPGELELDGLMRGTVAPLKTKEEYLVHSTGDLEDELRELEEEMLIPVR